MSHVWHRTLHHTPPSMASSSVGRCARISSYVSKALCQSPSDWSRSACNRARSKSSLRLTGKASWNHPALQTYDIDHFYNCLEMFVFENFVKKRSLRITSGRRYLRRWNRPVPFQMHQTSSLSSSHNYQKSKAMFTSSNVFYKCM